MTTELDNDILTYMFKKYLSAFNINYALVCKKWFKAYNNVTKKKITTYNLKYHLYNFNISVLKEKYATRFKLKLKNEKGKYITLMKDREKTIACDSKEKQMCSEIIKWLESF